MPGTILNNNEFIQFQPQYLKFISNYIIIKIITK